MNFKSIRKLAAVLLVLLATACAPKTVSMPMASFTVPTSSPQDVSAVWDKIRANLLINGFAFSNDRGHDSKLFVLKSDQDAKVLLSKNQEKGFVEVVFFHYKKASFGAEEEATFDSLKAAIQKAVNDHALVDSVPFRRGGN
jgi:hypothetical protein